MTNTYCSYLYFICYNISEQNSDKLIEDSDSSNVGLTGILYYCLNNMGFYNLINLINLIIYIKY